MLFVFAWSGVMLNISPVYDRVTGLLFDYHSDMADFSAMPSTPRERPRLDWHAAQRAGDRLLAEQAAIHGFTVGKPFGLAYLPEFGVYSYDVASSLDVRGHGWDTGVWLDGDTGELRKLFRPTGEHRGNTVSTWLRALHFADVHGSLAYRVFVCLLGLVITLLSYTGVYLWWRKRKAGRAARHLRKGLPYQARATS
jgi:uncharacterized iron-regulated membrane protein